MIRKRRAGQDGSHLVHEIIPGRVNTFVHGAIAADALRLHLAVAANDLVFQPIDRHFAVNLICAERKHVTCRKLLGGNQRIGSLFRHGDDGFAAVFIHIAQRDVRKFHPGHELELFLHAPPSLNRVFQQSAHLVFRHVFIRENQLNQAGHGLAHGDFVALVEFVI